ncbi:MAG: hypothetical protein ACT4QG_13005 [Sporichthyaceae bacterium]
MVPGPAIAEDVTGRELEKSVVRELSTLRAEAAELAAKHLVMAGRLLDEDPDLALEHALAARRQGPRVGVVREAVGIASYHAGKWTEALAELRAARRISGGVEHWPMMADCERALGRPERALTMASAPEAGQLDRAERVEMRIVVAGARADMGQLDAAVVTLQTPDLNGPDEAPWVGRLRAAYAAALEAVGRDDEARTWWERAAAADPEGQTGAAERLAELDGIVFYDDDDDDEEDDLDEDEFDRGASEEPREGSAAAVPLAPVGPAAGEPTPAGEGVAGTAASPHESVAAEPESPGEAVAMEAESSGDAVAEGPATAPEPTGEELAVESLEPLVRPAVTAQLFLEAPNLGPVHDPEDDADE